VTDRKPPAASPALALDREIALKYVAWLVDSGGADDAESRRAFCEASGFHPKLLAANPHVDAVAKLFRDQSSLERLGDMTLREYLVYHYYYIHQGYRYGAPRLYPVNSTGSRGATFRCATTCATPISIAASKPPPSVTGPRMYFARSLPLQMRFTKLLANSWSYVASRADVGALPPPVPSIPTKMGIAQPPRHP